MNKKGYVVIIVAILVAGAVAIGLAVATDHTNISEEIHQTEE